MASLPRLRLKPGKDHLALFRHPWFFSNALAGKIDDGALTDVFSSDGKRFIARGYYNSRSQIAFRTLTRDENAVIDEAFFIRRFCELLALRERFIDTRATNAFRVVFGESDGIPGLIIDKYADTLVFQIHTLGMDRLRGIVVKAMKAAHNPATIFEKSDVGVRRQEGLSDLPVEHRWGAKLASEIRIREHGIHFWVNIKDGQKTGFFLDQRENRKALQAYVKGARLLNAFCYTGGFSVYAALAGAREIVSVDVSAPALETAKRNFELNKIPSGRHRFLAEDVFDYLETCGREKRAFDAIILDPPAFVKNQKSLAKGLSGYLFINERALGLLPKGGVLVSSSCSAHVTDEMFHKMLAQAASRARCTLKTAEIRHQPLDHPFNPNFPEGKYLKFYVMIKA